MEIPDSHTENPNIQDKSTTLRNPDTKGNILVQKPVALISEDQIQTTIQSERSSPCAWPLFQLERAQEEHLSRR